MDIHSDGPLKACIPSSFKHSMNMALVSGGLRLFSPTLGTIPSMFSYLLVTLTYNFNFDALS